MTTQIEQCPEILWIPPLFLLYTVWLPYKTVRHSDSHVSWWRYSDITKLCFNYILCHYIDFSVRAHMHDSILTMYYDIICTVSLDIKKRRIYWLEFCCPKNTYILYQLGFLLHYNYTYFDYKQTLVHLTYLYTYKTYNTCIILNKLSSQSVFLLKLSFYLDDEDDDKNDDFVSPSSNKWMSDLILFLIFCWTWFTSSLAWIFCVRTGNISCSSTPVA